MLLAFMPFVNLVLLIFCVQDSEPGPNKYGPNPKAVPGEPAMAMAWAGGSSTSEIQRYFIVPLSL